MIRKLTLILALLAACAFAQEPKSETATKLDHAMYRLDFVLKQADHGKVLSTHNYSTSIMGHASSRAQIRTGDRVPVDTGGDKGISYVDVGFNCDVATTDAYPSAVSLDVTWDLSTMPAATGSEKLIRQVRVHSMPLAKFGKQTLVGSVDDINSTQQFELYVTVTPES